jgi:acetolactate synthase-1/3 small subunit
MVSAHTFSVYSDNSPGLLHRITVLFTRRKLNIESLTVSETENPGISRFTIMVHCERAAAEKVLRQIQRIVDVHEVFLCDDKELIVREVALFKVHSPEDRSEFDRLIQELRLHVVDEGDNHITLTASGTESDILATITALRPWGLHELVRSGRIALRRDGTQYRPDPAFLIGAPPSADEWI